MSAWHYITYFPAAQRAPKLEEMFLVLPAQLDPLDVDEFLAILQLHLVTAISKQMRVKRLVKEEWHPIESQQK
jgi:hypothetical protein